MKQIKIDRTVLHEIYMDHVNQICEDLEWKTHFGPKEIVDIMATILEKNPELIEEHETNQDDQSHCFDL
jgi:hypothetical protein